MSYECDSESSIHFFAIWRGDVIMLLSEERRIAGAFKKGVARFSALARWYDDC
jgi:hypothetical protein